MTWFDLISKETLLVQQIYKEEDAPCVVS
jgi:hypothetical protein